MPGPELRATYRLQLSPAFGFDAAAALVPYLAELGASHLYLSPCLQAAPGSTHGYDVVDPTRMNGELGGEEGFERLAAAAAQAGVGLVLDVVPNHMAAALPSNRWWWDVLEHGPASRFARSFDTAWTAPDGTGPLPVLLPILGEPAGRLAESGEARLEREGARVLVRLAAHRLPAAPESTGELWSAAAHAVGLEDVASAAGRLIDLPLGAEEAADRARILREVEQVLEGALAGYPALDVASSLGAAMDDELARRSADPAALEAFLDRQHWRAVSWRSARWEMSYRRFFDIDALVAVRVEDPEVFAATHERVLAAVRDGRAQGLRVDHVDGLRDPGAYLARLRAAAPDAFLWVEKILHRGEALPDWPVEGTTGYDFLALAQGLFVDPAGRAELERSFAEETGRRRRFEGVAATSKRAAARDLLGPELEQLTDLLEPICARERRHRDLPRGLLRATLVELAAQLRRYRTYVRPGERLRPEDARALEAAAERARARHDLDDELIDLVTDVLTLRRDVPSARELALRFQQVSSALEAKGVEDTACYRYHPLAASCEVGCNPGADVTSTADFHAALRAAAERWPRALLAGSTHDTKRGEDVRARLTLLSHVPDEWSAAVRRWTRHNERHRRHGAPDRPLELLYYQTLVGAWPLEVERALAYVEKAAREAKRRTNWLRPDAAFEKSLRAFVEGTLSDERFVEDLEAFVRPLVDPGRAVSLAQLALRLAAPGVPDVYQGTELWESSLVDPDNRRPVDFAARRTLLGELARLSADEVWSRRDEGLPKLALVHHGLALRRRHPRAFAPGSGHEPLAAHGERAADVVAFLRSGGDDRVLALVPRRVLPELPGADATLDLPPGRWHDPLTDREHEGTRSFAELCAPYPVALLEAR